MIIPKPYLFAKMKYTLACFGVFCYNTVQDF